MNTQPEPGWLERVCREATARMRLDHDRAFFRAVGAPRDYEGPYPLLWDEADELATLMSDRFKTWTGRTLEEHFAARNTQRQGMRE